MFSEVIFKIESVNRLSSMAGGEINRQIFLRHKINSRGEHLLACKRGCALRHSAVQVIVIQLLFGVCCDVYVKVVYRICTAAIVIDHYYVVFGQPLVGIFAYKVGAERGLDLTPLYFWGFVAV